MMNNNNNNNTSNLRPIFIEENHLQHHTNTSNQLQLVWNSPVGYKVDPVNYHGNDFNASAIQPNKRRNMNVETISFPTMLNKKRLSYEDNEHNSSITSQSGSLKSPPSLIMSLGDRQNEELDQYIKIQAQNLSKGMQDIKNRHMASFVSSIEKITAIKLHEKDKEIETINIKNRELMEKIKQVTTEAQNWLHRAKYHEYVVNVLKNNLHDANQEGYGDNETTDDATSCTGDKNMNMICRGCKGKEVCMMLIPCRHLSLCRECDAFVHACPVCQYVKTDSIQVYLS